MQDKGKGLGETTPAEQLASENRADSNRRKMIRRVLTGAPAILLLSARQAPANVVSGGLPSANKKS